MFRGRYQHTVDPKGRLSVPAKFRDVLAQYDGNLVVVPDGECLEVHPLEEWQRMEAKLREQSRFSAEVREIRAQLGFRSIDGFAERVVYREFFPRGLTALDDLDEIKLGTRPSLGHVTASEEVMSLLRLLKLPLDERGRRRAANRAEWFTQVDKPLEVHDILGA